MFDRPSWSMGLFYPSAIMSQVGPDNESTKQARKPVSGHGVANVTALSSSRVHHRVLV